MAHRPGLRRLLPARAAPTSTVHPLWTTTDPHGHRAPRVRTATVRTVRGRTRLRPRRRNDLGYSSAIYARTNITAALDLLTWLDKHHTTLDRFTQDQLERWLDEPVNRYKPIHGFIRWAAKARHVRELLVPPRRRGPSSPILDEEQRWQQLCHCPHDNSMPLPVRVVGTLTLLFGLTTSRILELTTDDIAITPDRVALIIGSSPIELPPRVADLVRRQHEHATSINLNAPELARWLLPGQGAALPVHPAHMSEQLIAAGLNARHGRYAALVDLVAALPPAVLATLLGVHISTAIAWSYRAQQDWSAYPAARRNEQVSSSRPSPP